MAQVNYQGSPEVAPPLQAPQDLQNIEASPASFGAGVAQGLGQAGEGAIDASKFFGQVSADNATNNFLTERSKILYGDPAAGMAVDSNGNPVQAPDGSIVHNGGFFSKQGRDALEAWQPTSERLQEVLNDGREGLSTPLARYQYDTESRRYYAQALADIGTHADTAQKKYATDTNTQTVQYNLATLARNPNDPATIAEAQGKIRDALYKNSQIAGENPAFALMKADSQVAEMRVRALLPTDAIAAQKVLQDNVGVLSSLPGYDFLSYTVNERALQARANHLATWMETGTPPPNADVGGSYLSALHAAEDGYGNPTARNPRSTATGLGQFLSRTWYDPKNPSASVMGQPQFADLVKGKTPQQILDLRTNPQVSDAATLAYAGMNAPVLESAGHPVNAATLGLAHRFGGPGANAVLGAAPNTPMSQLMPNIISANPELRNKTAGQVVQEFGQHYGTAPVNTSGDPVAGLLAGVSDDDRRNITDTAMGKVLTNIDRKRALNARVDDPNVTVSMWNQVYNHNMSSDDVMKVYNAGHLSESTARGMIDYVDTKKTDIEKEMYGTLKTAMGADDPTFSIFNDKPNAAARWANAQGEWAQRMAQRQDPSVALTSMVEKYVMPINPGAFPKPTWLENPIYSVSKSRGTIGINDMADLRGAVLATVNAKRAGKMDQATYDHQVGLLSLYRDYLTREGAASAAAQRALSLKRPVPGKAASTNTAEPTGG